MPQVEARNLGIECLRAVAILTVVLQHASGNLLSSPNILHAIEPHFGFWWGVDLFFAVSGFVIARRLLGRLAQARSGRETWGVIGAFWIRRFWRLMPSAWLWLALTLLACVVFNQSGVFGTLRANVMATLAGVFSVANFRLAQTMFHSEYGTSFVYWSLSLEEQFYLLLPLLAWIFRRRLNWIMVLLVLVQFSLFRTPLLMMVRTDALALGVLLAMGQAGRWHAACEPILLRRRPVLRCVLPLLLVAAMGMLSGGDLTLWRFRVGGIALCAVSMVWLASYPFGYLPFGGRLEKLLAWVGGRSYAIYLVHVPVYFFVREVSHRLVETGLVRDWPPAWALGGSAALLIVLLVHFNYRWVETPLRRFGAGVAARFEQRYGQTTSSKEVGYLENAAVEPG